MTIEYQYIDETVWNEYEVGVGVVNPRTSFVVRVTDGDDKFKTQLVQVCGDLFSPFIVINRVDTDELTSYQPIISGINPDEIEGVTWIVKEDGAVVSYVASMKEVTEVDKICVSATVQLNCGCDPIELGEICYTFTRDQVTCSEDIGLDMEIEDGCWKPVRLGTIPCCIALDIIIWKMNESDAWSILREPIETICADIVYFKRVVTFNGDVCETVSIEINSDEVSS